MGAGTRSRWRAQVLKSVATSGRQPARRIPILAYHFTGTPMDEEDAPITVPTSNFEEQIRHLAESGYRSIGLHELDRAYTSDPTATRFVAITFDDGRRCVYEKAFPILRKYNMRATVFLIGNRLDHHLFLSHEQIATMSGDGIWFESHCQSHRRLTTLAPSDQLRELEDSRHTLGVLLGQPPAYLAYPFGDYDDGVQALAKKAGYRAAVGTRTGLADAKSDPFGLPRVGVRRHDDMRRFTDKLNGEFQPPKPQGLVAGLRATASRLVHRHR